MAKSSLDQGRLVLRVVEPVNKLVSFGVQMVCRRRLEMHTLATDGARYDLHGAAGIVTPSDELSLDKPEYLVGNSAAASLTSAARSPAVSVYDGIEHHIEHALDFAGFDDVLG